MQTILGSGGAIGNALAKELTNYTSEIRLVSRNPEKMNPEDMLFPADLTSREQVEKAVLGSEVAYLTVGLPYNHKIWKSQWPVIMENVIQACMKHQCKLVFFDNIYMYEARSLDPITEDLPINPPSKKGTVRAEIFNRFMKAVNDEQLLGLVARSADFYGPGIKNVSILTETVFNPLSQGKKASWLGKIDKKHSFTYVPDAAKATALLGNTLEAYGEVWHLPTAPNPYTGKEWITKIAEGLHTEAKYQTAGKTMVRIIGLFNPIMKEMAEMVYQYDRDYVFDSSKFEKKFSVVPTPYDTGIKAIISSDYS